MFALLPFRLFIAFFLIFIGLPDSVWALRAEVTNILAGGADQTLEEFTDGLQFVDLALDIAAEPAKAKQIWDGIRQIRPETVKNIIREHVATYTAGGPKAFYQGGRDGITIAFMWKGLAGAATKLAGYASQLSSVADQVQQAGATMIGLVTGTSKVADEVLGLLKKLQSKFSNEQTFMAFLQDFGSDESLDLLRKFDAGELDVKAWEVLRESGSTAKKSIATLEKLSSLLKSNRFNWTSLEFNKTFTKLLKDVRPGTIITYVDDAGETVQDLVGKTLSEDELLDGLKALNDRRILNSEDVLKELCCESTWKFTGAEMVLRAALTTKPNPLWDQIQSFEQYVNGQNGGRFIDILLKTGKRIEVKSWKKLYSASFIKQFVQRDLTDINALSELGWVFDGKYPNGMAGLKADVEDVLRSASGKAALNALPPAKLNAYFPNSNPLTGLTDSDITDFVNRNFNSIFSLQ
ncbi:hypothetical protein F5984_10105 [Rudanella paleaurantiibacter]|uniref:Uncharacterized protein n=1 Tax=Rudanella paleaurantiibacter TaxID=2614655 RepID=A0A7J5U076_9BACT|nr:hypothetical protein [Rudanella paleaurantiibacter]KAB7731152.1 hypothetical protein F5984_10105 [Rudanella paleaurantiibacter]